MHVYCPSRHLIFSALCVNTAPLKHLQVCRLSSEEEELAKLGLYLLNAFNSTLSTAISSGIGGCTDAGEA